MGAVSGGAAAGVL
jgi:hypothetical protein